MKKNSIAIILVNYNGLSDTIECIESIKLSTFKNYKIIIIDNASTKDSFTDFEKKYSDEVIFIKSKENLGFAGANNVGIKYAIDNGYTHVMLLNNDTVIDPSLIDNLLMYSNDETIVTPKMYYYSNKNMIWYGGGEINKDTGKAIHEHIDESDNDEKNVKECTFTTGCCMMINVNIIKKIGMLSEEYFMYCEDTDYCLKALNNNIKILYNPNAKLWHKFSKSTGGSLSPFSVYYMTRNRFIYIKKYEEYFSKKAYWFTLFSRYVRIIQYWIRKDEIYKSIRKGIKDFNKKIVGKVDKYI